VGRKIKQDADPVLNDRWVSSRDRVFLPPRPEIRGRSCSKFILRCCRATGVAGKEEKEFAIMIPPFEAKDEPRKETA